MHLCTHDPSRTNELTKAHELHGIEVCGVTVLGASGRPARSVTRSGMIIDARGCHKRSLTLSLAFMTLTWYDEDLDLHITTAFTENILPKYFTTDNSEGTYFQDDLKVKVLSRLRVARGVKSNIRAHEVQGINIASGRLVQNAFEGQSFGCIHGAI